MIRFVPVLLILLASVLQPNKQTPTDVELNRAVIDGFFNGETTRVVPGTYFIEY